MSSPQHPTPDLRDRIAQLEAEKELGRLAHDFCNGLDRHDLELFLAVWAEDAEWINGGTSVHGRDEIAEMTTSIWSRLDETQHWTSTQVIDWSGPTPRATLEAGAVVHESGGHWTLGFVTYIDEYAFTEGRWLITRREGLGRSSQTLQ